MTKEFNEFAAIIQLNISLTPHSSTFRSCVYIFTYTDFVIWIVRECHRGKNCTYSAERAKERRKGRCKGGTRVIANGAPLHKRPLARARSARHSSLLMNPAKGTPLEEHFYFCHSVCRQSADRQFTMAIRGAASRFVLSRTAR